MEAKIKDKIIDLYEEIIAGRGMEPLFGKIFAILLLEDEPLTQKQISEETKYSISAVSETLSKLIKTGLVSTIKRKGERTNYYQIKYSPSELMIQNIYQISIKFKQLLREYDELLAIIKVKKDPNLSEYKSRIEELVRLYQYVDEGFDKLLMDLKTKLKMA